MGFGEVSCLHNQVVSRQATARPAILTAPSDLAVAVRVMRSFQPDNSTIAEIDGTAKRSAKASAHFCLRGCIVYTSFAVIFIFVGTYFADPSRLSLG